VISDLFPKKGLITPVLSQFAIGERVMTTQTAQTVYASMPESVAYTSSGWNPVCHITYTRDTWVKLLQRHSEYAFEEAKLLCQESSNTWIAWIPDHGEALLDKSEFYC
jgi:hypothetical protein